MTDQTKFLSNEQLLNAIDADLVSDCCAPAAALRGVLDLLRNINVPADFPTARAILLTVADGLCLFEESP